MNLKFWRKKENKMARNLFKEKQDKKTKDDGEKVISDKAKETQDQKEVQQRIITENELIRNQLDAILNNQALMYHALIKFAKKSVDIDLTEKD